MKKMQKSKGRKIVAVAVTLGILATSFVPPALGGGQPVHAAHWADSFLNNLASQDILRGDQNGNFNPDRNITRAEFAAMLNRAFGFEQGQGKSFSDVPQEAWYAGDIAFASYQGFMQGAGDGNANPNGALTREEAVTMLCRALKIAPKQVDTLSFADSKNFSSWSRGFINSAAEIGMLSGYPDNTFRPQNKITRGEVAKILATVAGNIVKQPTQAYLGYVNGNVTLSESGAGLRNTVITGDLYITEGVLSGYVFLENVTVLGKVIISGAGESYTGDSNIIFTDCDLNEVIVDVGHEKLASILAQGSTKIDSITVKSKTYLEDNSKRSPAFEKVTLDGPAATKLDLAGDFGEVIMASPGGELSLNRGSIEKLTAGETGPNGKVFLEKKTSLGELYADSKVDVTGTGTIEYARIGVSGVIVAQVPEEVILRPGVTASIGGREMSYLEAEMENASPRIVSGYPEIEDITINSASGQIMGNKPGTVYWAVKEAGGDTPAANEMLEPKNTQTILLSGNLPLIADQVEKEISAKVSGLKGGKPYELFVMLVDSKDNRSPVRQETFETLDKTIPAYISGYPKYKAVYTSATDSPANDHQLAFEVVPTKDCTVYWSVLPEKSNAPTQENFFARKVAGVLKQGTASASENEVCTFSVTGLAEYTPYDVYLGLKDSKGNMSPVTKVTMLTKDVTPPEFEKPYPRIGAVAEQTVEIQFMTNETTSLYWAVYPRGAKFPPSSASTGTGTSGGAIVPLLSSEEAKQAVKTGNSALKTGKAQTTAAKPGQFVVGGLKAQTSYDVYLLLEDGSGNKTPVYKMEITTKDDIPPTARMIFDDALVSAEGNPPVGSDITIGFSEPVFGGIEAARTALGEVPTAKLGEYIQLYNTSNDPRTPVIIDFSNVRFSEELGYTTATFPSASSAASGAAIVLESGARYVFELKNIKDMTGNGMKSNTQGIATRLPEFRTKAPFIKLKKIDKTGYDITFDITPMEQNAADSILYDNVLETDRKITFTLTEYHGSTMIKETKDLTMEPGRYYTMEYLRQDTLQCTYTKFNDLQPTQIGIAISAIEGNTDPNSWNGAVNISLRGVSGTKSGMEALAAGGGQKVKFTDFMKTGTDVAMVSDPQMLTATKYFEDMVAPAILTDYPKFGPGDSVIQMSVMTDKPCTMYWLAAPVSGMQTVPPVPMSQDQLMNGTWKTAGSKWGSFVVSNGNAVVSTMIRELDANTEYYVFYLAKGTKPSQIFYEKVTTGNVLSTNFASGYPMKAGQGKNMAYVDVQFVDANAEYYWAVYPVGIYKLGSSSPAPKAEEISERTLSTDTRLTDVGSGRVDMGIKQQITVKNLSEGQFFDFFIVARNPLGSGWTEVKELRNITASDQSAPQIKEIYTTVMNPEATQFETIRGSLVVNFTEPLYYINSQDGEWAPLTDGAIKGAIMSGGLAGVTVDTITTRTQPGSGAITGFTINFSNAFGGATIPCGLVIGDGVNTSGTLVLTFVRDKVDASASHWSATFKK